MSAAWFYNHRGRLQGPFEAEIILNKIKAGELGPDDLVYQEGEDKWKPISTVGEFSKSIPKPSASEKSKASEARQWVVLERNKNKANKQLGPYSSDEMKAMLSRGELKLSDYVWRNGMKEWYRVQAFEELIEDPVEIPETPTLPDLPTDVPENTQTSTQVGDEATEGAELQDVVQITYKEITAVEPMPEDIEGPDLSKSKVDPRDADNMETRVNYKLRPDALKKVRGTVQSGNFLLEFLKDMLSGTGARWVAIGLVALLVLFVGRGAYKRIGEFAKKEAPAMKTSSAASERVAAKPVVRAEVAPVVKPREREPQKPRPTAEPKIPATYVKLSIDSKKGILNVRTDASKHFSTRLTFTSLFGKVLGKNSYHRVLTRKDRELNLRELNWPRGYYSLEAAMGEHSSSATVFVGSGKGFSRELKGFKKRMTLDFINERVAFIKTADKLVDKATVFAMILRSASNNKAWRRDYGPWRRNFSKTSHPILRSIGPKSRSRYVLADIWLDLKQARRDLDKFTKSMSKKSKRTSKDSAAELNKIRNQLTKLSAKAQGRSLWR